ncbi:ABC transporter substrate-binding protein/permease [Tuwongella immobilis]|uniref:ABC transmembrane type-1 domain-containing protein n=1 Tax=Tuwongella immobilis TaxID=692036 RepID=A0A6C2YUQ5_9BACT|nr:ABC transporter substrate-binding protein/permease [Tuwongella immobilis]VIP05087.1 amino acid abc transporter permease : Amine acid ABC transporter, permease protein, 3-TM region, His/Glu/Gln/Arg/opine family OS=Singulisphaera acidiphila (strain ATCC BAA-1392 / DSM 18658 / VKM B-2454 / MOB10) GN=Sinac_5234 PE=4 SV=1: SBP_bac_3: BPD_transp_1 [Tuwongella immobilis]VTS07530.1 amino acid abc transporter permease : Amine acid ABC transporter, permease protein, 3-TM region, His/Glu/Gln/Arg/opine fa
MVRLLMLLLCLLGIGPSASFAQEKPLLRWGADKTGGIPYLFDNPANPRQLIGFEVDLADYLAKELGRKAEYVQGDWSKLPELLAKGNAIDVVMNGYEFSWTTEEQYPSTIPYFIYTLRLVAHPDDDSIQSWDDLRAKPGRPKKRVGVLTGSLAHRYLEREFKDDVEILANDDVANVYDLVSRKQQLDATVQDSPSAVYFLNHDYRGKLKLVGDAREPNFYVILTRSQDRELREALNAALRKGLQDGTLERIYKKYGLWTPEQLQLTEAHKANWPPERTEIRVIDWGLIWEKLLSAAWTTVKLTFLAMPLAILMGLMIAIGRLYGPWLLRVVLSVYVEVIRGTPLLLQLYVLFYLLPRVVSLDYPPFVFAVIGLAINYSAYEAEVYRAGLLSIPRGQMEAALAMGLTQRQALGLVIVPQAVRVVIPPVTNDFIALFKDTSVCSVILVTELTREYNVLYNGNRDLVIELAALTAMLYLFMSYPLSLLARQLEHQHPQARV